ncbi:MAG: hypothetical protein OXP74_15085 [Acidobacteriota bacterium]|nr:hypothetical protein [Acidobacteriota bacterium]
MARRRGFGALLATAWPLLACFAGLLVLDRAGFGPAPGAPGPGLSFLLVLLLAFGALWWGLRRLRAARASRGDARPDAGQHPGGASPRHQRHGPSARPRAVGRQAGAPTDVPVAGVLAVAVVLRLLALPLAPSLSDDVYRYLWDGRVAASGANPYLVAPDDESLTGLRDDLWRKTAHRDVATVYPPLALGMFAGATTLPRPLFAYKMALAGVDLAGCALLLLLARRRGNAWAALAYVWNPLLVVEGAGMGHVDVVGASLVIGCVWLLLGGKRREGGRPDGRPDFEAASGGSRRGRRRTQCATPTEVQTGCADVPVGPPKDTREAEGLAPLGRSGTQWAVAGVVGALAVLAKLVPLAVLPLWWRSGYGRGRRLFAVGAGALLLPATVGVLLWTRGVPPGLVEYALRWEYNGPLYEPLWRLIGSLRLDLAASGVVHVVRVIFGGDVEATPWSTLYSYAYPQFLARVALLAAGAVLWLRLWRRRPGPVRAAFGAFAVVLLMSPTFYPWYLIWILPWAAVTHARAVLALSATLPLAYLPALTGLPYFPWVYGAVWLPPLFLLVLERRRPEPPSP